MFKEHKHEQLDRLSREEVESIGLGQPLLDKKCSICGKFQATNAYYSKGSRIDSTCKACVLRKKKKSYRKQKATAASLKSVRKNSKILTFSEDQIEEKKADSSNVDLSHLEDLLRQFTFESICRNGGEHGEK